MEPLGGSGKPGELMLLQGVDMVLDVGAAVGSYGRWIREAGYQGRICSFEPLSAAVQAAPADDRRLIRSGSAATWPSGPSRGPRRSTSPATPTAALCCRWRSATSRRPRARFTSARETVEVTTLDDIWDEVVGDAKKPFLKLDVQGYELETLRGGSKILPRLYGVQAELSLLPLYEGGPLWTRGDRVHDRPRLPRRGTRGGVYRPGDRRDAPGGRPSSSATEPTRSPRRTLRASRRRCRQPRRSSTSGPIRSTPI